MLAYAPFTTLFTSKFALEQAMKAQRGVGAEVQLYSFFNFGARWEWEVRDMPGPLYPRKRDPAPIA
jgi:hypothetical protein